MFARRLLSAFAALTLVAFLLPVTAAPVAAESSATVPAGFADKVVWSGITDPTVVAFAPGGKVFVGQKSGRILEYDSLTDTSATVFGDLTTEVQNYWDRGLLGLTVDPAFPTRPYVYALYTYDHILGDAAAAPRWGDACPSTSATPPGPGATTDGCVVSGRLVRLTWSASSSTFTAKKVLIEDWCQQFPSHSIGSLFFGPEGALYATGGDGASFTGVDYGQRGGSSPSSPTPVNPCGDPSLEGGALRSQDVRSSGDATGLDGTVIRVDPDTGAPWPDNANFGSGDTNRQRIIAYGLRNPFRTTMRSDGTVWVGEVGYGDWEEINKIPDPNAAPRNFGWPCYEGNGPQPAYQGNSPELTMCTGLSAPTAPAFTYNHLANVVAGDGCTPGSSAVAGVAFRGTADNWPSRYANGLFFTDYSRRCIWFVPPGGGGDPDFGSIEKFADLRRSGDTNGGAVYLGFTPAGNLIYADLDRDEIRQITYDANLPPTASFTASPTSGVAPLKVTFNGSGSHDPNGDALTYAWDLNGDGQYDDATGVSTTHTYTSAGDVVVGLKVTDPDGVSDTVAKTIHPGNSAPSATITSPATSFTWAVGDDIAFAGTATDAQDGPLGAAAFSWTFIMEHCPSNCHEHTIQTVDGVTSGTFTAPNHDYPSHLRIALTVTDSNGLSTTVTRDIQPKTTTVSAVSSPAGVPITVGSGNGAPPPTVTAIVGGDPITVSAPDTITVGETDYTFDHWSDGGARTHDVAATAGAKHLTAFFTVTATTDASDTCAGAGVVTPGSTWLDARLGTGTDVDWFRFTNPSTRTVQIVLGGLPQAASIALFQGCSKVVASSDRGGTHSEEIVKTLAKGTYAVRVSALGTGSTDHYALRIRRLSSGLGVLSASSQVDSGAGRLTLVGEVWNGASSTRGPITVTAKLWDGVGKSLGTWTAQTRVYAVSHGRVAFKMRGALPAGFASVTYTVSGTAPKSTIRGVSKHTTSFAVQDGRWRARGSLKATSGAVKGLRVTLTLYDTRCDVIDVVNATLGKTTLASGASTSFDAWSTQTGLAVDHGYVRALGFRR